MGAALDAAAVRRRRRRADVAALLLAACGGDGDDGSEAAGGGQWAFTDGRGVRVSLESPPKRIVMQEYAAAHFMPLGVKPVGIFGSVPLGGIRRMRGSI